MMEQLESTSSRSSISLIEESSTIPEKAVAPAIRDYYTILEVPSNASGEHIGVSFNRIYNQMIALQHSGPQTDEAAASFKELTEAYDVLSDPTRRRAYDRRNQPVPNAQPDSIVGRAFGAIASRFGAPAASSAPTSGLPADVLDAVAIMCQHGGIEGQGPPMDPRVNELSWGTAAEAKVDRQAACYYRISISRDDIDNGFIIHCKSASKDKFKLVMFDSSGRLLYKEESSRSAYKPNTETTLFFVSYDLVNENGSMHQPSSPISPAADSPTLEGGHGSEPNSPIAERKDIEGDRIDAPHRPVSDKIDALICPKRSVAAGQYLLVVFGDNLIAKSSFSLVAVMALNSAPEVLHSASYMNTCIHAIVLFVLSYMHHFCLRIPAILLNFPLAPSSLSFFLFSLSVYTT